MTSAWTPTPWPQRPASSAHPRHREARCPCEYRDHDAATATTPRDLMKSNTAASRAEFDGRPLANLNAKRRQNAKRHHNTATATRPARSSTAGPSWISTTSPSRSSTASPSRISAPSKTKQRQATPSNAKIPRCVSQRQVTQTPRTPTTPRKDRGPTSGLSND